METNSKRTQALETRYGCRTDVGCVREHNEDSLIANPPLFAVADGMGGHAAGEVASEIAVQTLREKATGGMSAELLASAVSDANQAILQAVEDGIGREGMGTTLTAALIQGERLIIAQVGDSRAYLLHQGRLQQITRDHSLVFELIEAGQLTPEEARFHPNRSIITRALGSGTNTTPDIYELNVVPGDRLLLCSDGLSSMVEDAAIEEILIDDTTPDECASQLVEKACEMGGYDNVTAIIVDIAGFSEKREKKMSRRAKLTAILICCLLVGAIAAAFIGFNVWVNNAVYLADNNGTVAIFTGMHDSPFGQDASKLAETSNVETSKLNPGLAARLKEDGVAADNIESAEQLLKGYAEELKMENLQITQVS